MLSKLRKKLAFGGILAGFLAALIIFGSYFSVQKTDAYKVSLSYIERSAVLKARFYPGTTCTLDLFGYSIRERGVTGKAWFRFEACGSKGSDRLVIELIKDLDVWKVTRIRLNDEEVIDAEAG